METSTVSFLAEKMPCRLKQNWQLQFSFLIIAVALSTSCSLFTQEDKEKYEPYLYNQDGSVLYYASDKYFGIAFDWNYPHKKVDSILASYNLIAERRIWDNAWTVYSKVGRPAKEFFTTYKRPATTLGDSSFVQFALPRIKIKETLGTDEYAHLWDRFTLTSFADSSASKFVQENIPNSSFVIDAWNQLYNLYTYSCFLTNEEGVNHQEMLNIVYQSDDSLRISIGINYQVESHSGGAPLFVNQ